jgi:hypothetical protein
VQAAGKVAINGTVADKTLHVHGAIMGGSGSSVGGSEVLIAEYSEGSDDQPNIIGTSRSSSAWYICYGLRPSTATADTFTSSVDNSTWYRGAFRFGGDYAAFRSNGGSAVNTAVGTTIATSEYVRMDHMGISFNGDTAAANHLDDYEEGTWTPTLTYGSCTITGATYTKIGRTVYAEALLTSFTDRSTASAVKVSGLPYNSSSTTRAGNVSLSRYINRNGDAVVSYLGPSRNYMHFYSTVANADYEQVYHSHLSSTSSNVYISIVYETS